MWSNHEKGKQATNLKTLKDEVIKIIKKKNKNLDIQKELKKMITKFKKEIKYW